MGIRSERVGTLRVRGRWWIVLVLGAYVVLLLLGITNSSLAMLDDPSDGTQGLLSGHPRPIRSDEWIKATPMLIGQLASGDSAFMPTLGTPILNGGTSTAGPVSGLLSAEYVVAGRLARWDLDAGLAAAWWFPAVLFALGLPSLLRRFGVPCRWP